MSWTNTAGSEEDLTKAAKDIFAQLKVLWLSEPDGYKDYDYWHLGNSFDTIIDYLIYVSSSEAADFPPIALAAFARSLGSACWYDDHGWWGIAALKAALARTQKSQLFKDDDVKRFRTISHMCWAVMHDNAPNVWANNKDDPGSASRKPRFDGGVWNNDWSRPDCCGGNNAPPELPPCPDNDPPNYPFGIQGSHLTGIQNTVTNGLYLVLALRLYQATQNTDYRDAASREYDFLNQWFDFDTADDALLHRVTDDDGHLTWALVRERIATYATGAHVCGYEPNLAWSGDQGIIVGGLIDRMIVVPADDKPDSAAFKNADSILGGVRGLTNKLHAGIVQRWTIGVGGDPEDYETGVGVFMRYLLYADQKNPSIRPHLRTIDYQKLISANTKEALKLVPVGASLTALTNALAILVAGIVMSKN